MNHLHRDLAPITDTGWDLIDEEAKGRLTTYLAARKLVDFDGPHGWSHSATNLGRIATISGPSEGVAAAQRQGPAPGRAPGRVQGLAGAARRRRPGRHSTSTSTNWTRRCGRSPSGRT